jgi:glycosyltransferase involved in cell wall biosynthesis
MKKIKVAHILHSLGGVDIYLRLVLDNIDENSFESIIVHGTKDTNIPFFDKTGNKVKEYSVPMFRNISLVNDLKSIYQTYKILKNEKPNLIHAHSAKGGIVGRIVGKFLGIKVLYTPHAFSYLSSESSIKRHLFLLIEKVFSKGNIILLATSESEMKRGINEVKFKKEKAIYLNNSINAIDTITPLTIKKTWPDNYICTVGRPSYQKNIELMIKVFHKLKQELKIHLVIMGVGPVSDHLESVKKLIDQLDMTNDVTLLVWTERLDVLNIIQQSKMYVSTSRYEGMPYAIIESLALSKPCVVSNCDGNNDLIIDGYNGFVIKNNAIDRFKDKIVSLLNNQELADEFSKNAHQTFLEKCDIKTNIKTLQSIYLEYS